MLRKAIYISGGFGGGGGLSFCFNADDLSVNLTSVTIFSIRLFG